jgi:hypothetical protein
LNMKAKAYIMAGVHEDYLEHFVNLKLAKEMWVKIDEIWQSRSVATLTSKKNELENYRIPIGEDVAIHVGKMDGIRRRLKDSELEVKDAEMVTRLMKALPHEEWLTYLQGLRSYMTVDALNDYQSFKAKILNEYQLRVDSGEVKGKKKAFVVVPNKEEKKNHGGSS